MKELYIDKTFTDKSLAMIAICNAIVTDYVAQGYRLTIRQLYYQLVARDHIPNTVRRYDNIVALMTNARLAGLIDWDAIEDRTRGLVDRTHWEGGDHILEAAASTYHEDMWEEQPYRVFVIVEKEALAGVLERTCHKWDVPLLPATSRVRFEYTSDLPSGSSAKRLSQSLSSAPPSFFLVHCEKISSDSRWCCRTSLTSQRSSGFA